MKMKMRFFYLLVINSILSHFILYTPVNLHERLYKGTLISILVSLIITCINAYMVIYVYNKFKDNNIIEIHNILFGKVIGTIFNLIVLILNLLISFFMYRGLIEIIIKYMLPSTPIYIIAIVIIVLPYANLFNNERSYLRYISLISVIILLYTIIQVIISSRNVNLDYIIGVFSHSKLQPDLIGIAVAGFFFSGINHLSIFNPVLSKLSWKKTCLLFASIGVITALSTILIPVGIWGPLAVQNIQLVWVTTSDTLSVELFFIERVLYILIPLFFMLASCQTLNYGFVGYTLIKKLIPNRKIDLILVNILGVLYIVFSTYIRETERLFKYGTIAMAVAFYSYQILSLLMYIMCKVKERRINNEEVT